MNIVRLLAAPAAAAVLALAGTASPAAAAPAQHVNDRACFDFPPFQSCFTAKYVFKTNESAAGNVLIMANGKTTSTFSENGALIYESEGKFHDNIHLKDGEVHNLQFKSSGSFGDALQDCTYSFHFHVVDGKIVKDDSTLVCAPV